MPRRKRGELTALQPLQWSRKSPLSRISADELLDAKALANALAVKVQAVQVTDPALVLEKPVFVPPEPPFTVQFVSTIDPDAGLLNAKLPVLPVGPPVSAQFDPLIVPELLLNATQAFVPPTRVQFVNVNVPPELIKACPAFPPVIVVFEMEPVLLAELKNAVLPPLIILQLFKLSAPVEDMVTA